MVEKTADRMTDMADEKLVQELFALEEEIAHAERENRLLCSIQCAAADAIRDEEEAVDRQEQLLRQLQAMPATSRGSDLWIQLQAAEVQASRDVEEAAEARIHAGRRLESMTIESCPRRIENAAAREERFLWQALEELEVRYAEEMAVLEQRMMEEKATLEQLLHVVVGLQSRKEL